MCSNRKNKWSNSSSTYHKHHNHNRHHYYEDKSSNLNCVTNKETEETVHQKKGKGPNRKTERHISVLCLEICIGSNI